MRRTNVTTIGPLALATSLALAACEMTLAEYPGPGTPPSDATVPLTVEKTVHKYSYLGLRIERQIIGRIHYVDDVKIPQPRARVLGVSEPMVSRAMLVPGERNCVAVRYTAEEPLTEPVYLGRTIFPLYPREADVLTLVPTFHDWGLHVIVRTEDGEKYFELGEPEDRPGTPPVHRQPEVSEEDVAACAAMLSGKTPKREDW